MLPLSSPRTACIAVVCCLSLGVLPAAAVAVDSPPELRDGDRVVLLGGAFVERLQTHGYLETAITAALPEKNLTFRNLGWSGDTVWGDSRGVFGSRADGFKRLLGDVEIAKPTLLVICYGENEAYAGEAGLDEFRGGLNALLDALKPTKARVLLVGPKKHEKLGPPLPDPAEYNAIAHLRGLGATSKTSPIPIRSSSGRRSSCPRGSRSICTPPIR
jgi:hypothetical protein